MSMTPLIGYRCALSGKMPLSFGVRASGAKAHPADSKNCPLGYDPKKRQFFHVAVKNRGISSGVGVNAISLEKAYQTLYDHKGSQ